MPESDETNQKKLTTVNQVVDIEKLTISVTVSGLTFNRSLADDLAVSEQNINQFLVQNPGKVAYWSTWHGKAKVAADELKLFHVETYARVRERKRNEAREELTRNLLHYGNQTKDIQATMPKPSMPTVSEIDDRALLDDEVQEAAQKVIKASEVVALLGAAVQAMRDLSSTLISLSANMRTEWQSISNTHGHSNPSDALRVNQAVGGIKTAILDGVKQSIFPGWNGTTQGTTAVNSNSPQNTAASRVSSHSDPVDVALSRMLGQNGPPHSGWHQHPKTGEWYPPEIQFDENGNQVPF